MRRRATTNPYMQGTPQSQPIPGREADMAPNNAGGYSFVLDDWKRLERFLVLGSEGGTYYVSQAKLTKENAIAVLRCIAENGARAVAMAVNVNLTNRAPKTDPQLFVLALAAQFGNAETKAAVAVVAPKVLRTGTFLLHFVGMIDSVGGWGRSKTRLIRKWFDENKAETVAFQVMKYRSRDGWSMRDVLRLVHAKAPDAEHAAIYDWVCHEAAKSQPWKSGKAELVGEYLDPRLALYREGMAEIASGALTVEDFAIAALSMDMPREALPTEALNLPVVWHELLPKTPPHALLRNLGRLTASGVLASGNEAEAVVLEKLTDHNAMQKARVHPFAIMLALLTYSKGHGVRGNLTWVPVNSIVDALETAYDEAYSYTKPTGKRLCVAIDVSGSMTAHQCIGAPIMAAEAAAAVAITLARHEPHATVIYADTTFRRTIPVTRRTTITSLPHMDGGRTDLAAAVLWASQNGHMFDGFVILTDNETWAGDVHTSQALADYRQQINPACKLVCCSFAANHANIIDPTDPLSMGCAGLDAAVPMLVSDFMRDQQTPVDQKQIEYDGEDEDDA